MDRRGFLGSVGRAGFAAAMGSMAGFLSGTARAGEWEQGAVEHWTNGSFSQDNLDISGESGGIMRARIDGSWTEFPRTPLPDAFMEWNLAARLEMLDSISRLMMGGEGQGPSLAGPHNAAMATYSALRRDSLMTVNNAFKGMGLCPLADRIGGLIDHMRGTAGASMPEKLAYLTELYSDSGNFDRTRMISLELYATPDFETHTFLNILSNPSTSLVFLDSTSFEVRGMAELVHPDNTSAPAYSRDLVTYTNLAHSYFHGDFPRLFPGIIVHVVEVFDNSPGTGRGVRSAPSLV